VQHNEDAPDKVKCAINSIVDDDDDNENDVDDDNVLSKIECGFERWQVGNCKHFVQNCRKIPISYREMEISL
jgi:hypothetical protein